GWVTQNIATDTWSSTCDIQQRARHCCSPCFLFLRWRRPRRHPLQPHPACPRQPSRRRVPRCAPPAPSTYRNSVLASNAATVGCANACALTAPSYPANASQPGRACARCERPKGPETKTDVVLRSRDGCRSLSRFSPVFSPLWRAASRANLTQSDPRSHTLTLGRNCADISEHKCALELPAPAPIGCAGGALRHFAMVGV